MPFEDRLDAARKLAGKLRKYAGDPNAIILAIPRGALEMGYALSQELGLPLDALVSKKIPFPGEPELAIGAVAFGGEVSLDEGALAAYGISKEYVEEQRKELARMVEEKYARYAQGRKFPALRGKTVILVDDGIATGHTMIAAIKAARKLGAEKVVVAVPVAASDSARAIEPLADEFVCLEIPVFFMAVGQFYRVFRQVEDEEAIAYLNKARKAGKG
ncbi:MAG: phosphoribosyltransferase family protein [Candidatus Micrarchaeia archaeon]